MLNIDIKPKIQFSSWIHYKQPYLWNAMVVLRCIWQLAIYLCRKIVLTIYQNISQKFDVRVYDKNKKKEKAFTQIFVILDYTLNPNSLSFHHLSDIARMRFHLVLITLISLFCTVLLRCTSREEISSLVTTITLQTRYRHRLYGVQTFTKAAV